MYVLLSEINNRCAEGLPGWYVYPRQPSRMWKLDTLIQCIWPWRSKISGLVHKKLVVWSTARLCTKLQPQSVNGQQSKPLKTCSQRSYQLRKYCWSMVDGLRSQCGTTQSGCGCVHCMYGQRSTTKSQLGHVKPLKRAGQSF